jgi:Ca-activated chloride channel family protein
MSPVFILVLVVIVVIAAVYLFGLKPDPARGRRPVPAILRRRSRWRKILPVFPLVAAVGCLVVAFSGFRFSAREASPMILLVIDESNSMTATDVVPSRLAAAEDAARAFLDELPTNFRVGLVTFSEEARVAVPPTQDRARIVDALGALSTSRGTVIGDGLSVALDAIEETRGAEDAAAVLLSDGQDTGSSVSPRDAAERASDMGVPVFTVLIGQVRGEDGGGPSLATMEEIAFTSGGETFTAETAAELTTRYQDIGSQLSVDLDVKPFSTPLVIAAIALTVLAGIMLVLTPR